MCIKLPSTSRGWQITQHITGGLYQILLMLTGVSFGQKEWTLALILSVTTFILNRLSSEISYRTQVLIVKEHSNHK